MSVVSTQAEQDRPGMLLRFKDKESFSEHSGRKHRLPRNKMRQTASLRSHGSPPPLLSSRAT